MSGTQRAVPEALGRRAAGARGRALVRSAKNEFLYAVALIAITVARRAPRAWLTRAGRWIGALAHAILPRARELARSNVARAYPDLSSRARNDMVAAVFRTLGENLGDAVALLRPSEDPAASLDLPERDEQVLRAALAEKRGVVYVTLHLGPWERMAALLAQRGFPITTVARDSYDPRFHRLVYDPLRAARGVEVIYRRRPEAPVAIVRALRTGRVVGFAVDLADHVQSSPVTLLGGRSRLAIGPLRIALRTGAPVVVGTPAPGRDGTLTVRIERLQAPALQTTLDCLEEAAQTMADVVAARIRALPLHWPWMHDSFGPMSRTEDTSPVPEPGSDR